jgi:serine/threonine protein kinase
LSTRMKLDQKIHLVTTPWAPFTLMNFLQRDGAVRRAECPWFEPRSSDSNHIILRIMFELSDGICYLPRKSVKHKDIKPDNILLHLESSRNVRPIITDFGVSKIYGKGGSTDYILSTWTYLAFEQLDKAESSLKSDVWQLGCCFALILALACGGLVAVERLWDSFENTDDLRSCNIAQELSYFMPVLAEVCSHQPQVLYVVRGMLEKEPVPRWGIETVWRSWTSYWRSLMTTGNRPAAPLPFSAMTRFRELLY